MWSTVENIMDQELDSSNLWAEQKGDKGSVRVREYMKLMLMLDNLLNFGLFLCYPARSCL